MQKIIILIICLLTFEGVFSQKKKDKKATEDTWYQFLQTENGSRLHLSFPIEYELMKESQTRGRTWYVSARDTAKKTTYLLNCTFHDKVLTEVGEEALVQTTFLTFEESSKSILVKSESVKSGNYTGMRGQFLDKNKGIAYEYEAFQKGGLQIQLMIAHPYKIYEEEKYNRFFESLKIE